MSIKDLQKEIRQKEGLIVSDGTLLNSDLLDAFYGIIEGYNLKTSFKQEIKEIFKKHTIEEIDFTKDHNLADQISWLINEICIDYFNDIAPNGYYFGAQEGDGACFGFWKWEE